MFKSCLLDYLIYGGETLRKDVSDPRGTLERLQHDGWKHLWVRTRHRHHWVGTKPNWSRVSGLVCRDVVEQFSKDSRHRRHWKRGTR